MSGSKVSEHLVQDHPNAIGAVYCIQFNMSAGANTTFTLAGAGLVFLQHCKANRSRLLAFADLCSKQLSSTACSMAAYTATQQPKCAAPQQAAPMALEMPAPPPPPGAPPRIMKLASGAFVRQQNQPKPPAPVRTVAAAPKPPAPVRTVADNEAPVGNNAAPKNDNEAPVADKAAPHGDNAAPAADNAAPVGGNEAFVADNAAPNGDNAAPVGGNAGHLVDDPFSADVDGHMCNENKEQSVN